MAQQTAAYTKRPNCVNITRSFIAIVFYEASSDCYSAALKRTPPFYAITLSPEEFDSLRYFLPVVDNFYQYYLYVYNKPPSIGKPYFRSTTDQSSAKARASNN